MKNVSKEAEEKARKMCEELEDLAIRTNQELVRIVGRTFGHKIPVEPLLVSYLKFLELMVGCFVSGFISTRLEEGGDGCEQEV